MNKLKVLCNGIGKIKNVSGFYVCVVDEKLPRNVIEKRFKENFNKLPKYENFYVFWRGVYEGGKKFGKFPEDYVPNEIIKKRNVNKELNEILVVDPAERFSTNVKGFTEGIVDKDIILTDEKSFEKEAKKYEWDFIQHKMNELLT